MEFQFKLLLVEKNLNKEEVQALAFLCSDLIDKDLNCVSAKDLFSLLADSDLLTAESPELLAELLCISKKNGLLRRLDLQSPSKSVVSPYRKLLFDLSENITEDDLKGIKFLLQDILPRRKLEDSVTMLKLLWELEKEDHLSDTNLDTLENIIGKVCPSLKKRISRYKTENVLAGPVTQETGTAGVTMRRHLSEKIPTVSTGDQASFSHARPASMGSFPEGAARSLWEPLRCASSEVLLPPSCFTSLPRSQVQGPYNVNFFEHSSAGLFETQDNSLEGLSLRFSQFSSSEDTNMSCSSEQSLHVAYSSSYEEKNLSATEPPLGENPELEAYEMKGERRGFCLIINNFDFSKSQSLGNREGTHLDEESLKEVFEWLGFETRTERDCSRKSMLCLLEALCREDHSATDCLVCCVLSHGLEGMVYGVDGAEVPLREITEHFSGNRCASLKGKPKLFFIQACQGKKEQRAVFVESDSPVPGSARTELASDAFLPRDSIPESADFLLGMATTPEFVSFRDRKQGSWYIQSLCENLKLLVPRGVDLLSILTKVNCDVGGKSDKAGFRKQMPQPVYSLRKKVVFPIPKLPPPGAQGQIMAQDLKGHP
ncbi:caspase-8 [Megalops cyprinoides]|uniref:caspase-8 n=1 Tax=Megalops cyprinoides TaxID=118141 RepID=UPI0018648406|nr:caspase-8 [Megalops cyprinoides]